MDLTAAPVETSLGGHRVRLKIRQGNRTLPSQPQEAGQKADIFGRPSEPFEAPGAVVELLIDDKPLTGLLQHISFSIDASTLVPVLTVTLIPRDLDVDIDLKDALLRAKILQAFALTDTRVHPVCQPAEPVAADKLIASYREAFPPK